MDGCGWNICNPGLNCVSHASKCLLCFTIIHLIIHISQIHTLQISHLLNSLQNRQAGGCVLLQGQRGTEDWSEGRRWRGATPISEHSSSSSPLLLFARTFAFYALSTCVSADFLHQTNLHPPPRSLCWPSLAPLLSMFFLCVFPQTEKDKIVLFALNIV